MTIEGAWSVFAAGSAGGALAELLHWWNLRTADVLPTYAKRPRYWIVTALMVATGGLLSFAQFGERAEMFVAIEVGILAPIIVQKTIAATAPTGARGADSLYNFFVW